MPTDLDAHRVWIEDKSTAYVITAVERPMIGQEYVVDDTDLIVKILDDTVVGQVGVR